MCFTLGTEVQQWIRFIRYYRSLVSFGRASSSNLMIVVHISGPEANVHSYRQTDNGNIFCGLWKELFGNLDGWDLSSVLLLAGIKK